MTEYLHADPQRRTDIRFPSAGEELAGHLYRPPQVQPGEPTPAVALCGPISSVKEQTVPHYAERLADAGYTALTFDPRGFGT
jgi:dipeptidyl aminopeptidase/acylaminoacyl peptidase